MVYVYGLVQFRECTIRFDKANPAELGFLQYPFKGIRTFRQIIFLQKKQK